MILFHSQNIEFPFFPLCAPRENHFSTYSRIGAWGGIVVRPVQSVDTSTSTTIRIILNDAKEKEFLLFHSTIGVYVWATRWPLKYLE